ncbi:MAG: hypothetical protein IT236_01490 [Bacteroidia bacterium]|nr:hypothetical protein [Bacteroidia bacterium]
MEQEKLPFVNEEEKLKIRLERSHEERFRILMKLIRINKKIRTAKVVAPNTDHYSLS